MKKLLIVLLLSIGVKTNALTVEQVWSEIQCNELYHPEIVLAQSIKEAGWEYTSWNVFKRNNLFGIKGGKKTESNKYGYKIYSHWTESVLAYKEKIQEGRYIEGEDYYQFLIRIRYFEADPNVYISDLKWIINRLKKLNIICLKQGI